MPFIDFTAGEVLTAAQMDTTFRQGVMVFDDVTDRNTQLSGSLAEGMTVYLKDNNSFYYYNGSAWRPWLTRWTSFTPSWTNLLVTGATNIGQYRYVGDSMDIKVKLTAGVGTTIGVDGIPSFLIPNSETSAGDGVRNLGTVWYLDATSTDYVGTCQCLPSGQGVFLYTNNVQPVSDTTPFTWANTDSIDVNISVRVA